MDNYPKQVTKQCTEKILEQMNNAIYKINENNGKFEIGFFCLIKHQSEKIPVLMINKYIKDEDKEFSSSIKVSINDKDELLEIAYLYRNKTYKITIIVLKKIENLNINFLDIDDELCDEESEMYYIKISIYIIQWNNMKDTSVSYGVIKNVKESLIQYFCNLNLNSKISLIFNLSNNKLIGFNEIGSNLLNTGIFFKYIIKEGINKYIYDNKFRNNKIYKYHKALKNEIDILIKVNEEDINNNIYFLDNYENIDKEDKSHIHDNLKEFNDSNIEI